MKKTRIAKPQPIPSDDMRPEYRFDYRRARRNRFAGRIDKNRLVVLLDPDISKVFTTPQSVKSVLRALIAAMPRTGGAKRRKA